MNVKIHKQEHEIDYFDRIGKVTLCVVNGIDGSVGKGVAIKSPRDYDYPELGEKIAYGRALKDLLVSQGG